MKKFIILLFAATIGTTAIAEEKLIAQTSDVYYAPAAGTSTGMSFIPLGVGIVVVGAAAAIIIATSSSNGSHGGASSHS